ncbi:MAG: hypothetical protein UX87_C0037G0007 [Candidatus Amesbacteria bacterium GW2011_GWA1_47_16]|uniref:Uncharacterized protein n=3 Tax=Candidatus Amesiibacteriota TaxID=1752730 RepID=A0A0G1S0R3_9BACT|nr:MAG: hypothetical protein UX86_C0040G0015 [Candidatus Amesbacteria bacterium GW2011_GWC1_47_15]KKU63009.1 MAG: hypothetical protein UX87_C0037G0007 [Candidatus Amesbacteria bacterium GW2011_GWA1_47_16]KKU97423.1 MAG: hypothetical protein UY28_C0021G0010 [Candidatus Amesbacteria bacterium GW2011_GWB1_48_13]OGC98739.1 MAG: hypothetical protein A2701_01470 [Candidatus Amesbacteria bacterium RIFCSPHIGHO2_01_FULL_47_34]
MSYSPEQISNARNLICSHCTSRTINGCLKGVDPSAILDMSTDQEGCSLETKLPKQPVKLKNAANFPSIC